MPTMTALGTGNETVTVGRVPMQHTHVLVADDNAMNREITRSFLAAAGHEVDCAEGGVQALAAVAAIDYDVILMDVRMPDLDGLETTRRIRALPGRRGQVPIVAVTAQTFAEQIEECRNAGMDKHLSKPFTQGTLLNVLANAIADRRPCEESATGSDLEVFNAEVFRHAAAFLASGDIVSYVQTITRRSEALLSALQAVPTPIAAAEMAQELAGSAGMIGFDRHSAMARQFEHAAQNPAADTSELTDRLVTTIKDTLRELQRYDSPIWTGLNSP
jgi:two-component system sensor histidine kinase/response regulator